jgi:DNA replication protein DnaC
MLPEGSEDRVRAGLEELRLRRMAEVLDRVLEQAAKADASYLTVLDQLVEAERTARFERTVEMKRRLAHLPFCKTMADFDYAFQPSVDKKQVQELLTLRFITAAENVLVLGPPGVGKTHIAVALALEAINRGYSTYFITMHQLVDYLADGRDAVSSKLRVLLRPKLLVVDEVGYLPLDRTAANHFFELVSRRYERGSIILTSNKSYADWGTLFPEVAIAAATLDRLLHHATTLNIRGDSYRLKDKRRAGLLTGSAAPPAPPRDHAAAE